MKKLACVALLAAFVSGATGGAASAREGGGLSGLAIRGIDIMKWTKDTLRSQPSDETIERVVGCLATNLNVTHIAVAVPLDATMEYPRPRPGPKSAEEFTKTICDAIHRRGLGIIHRGTWLGIEGLYGHPKEVGARRRPAGTALAVLSGRDRTTWLGKTYHFILEHPGLFADGDIWAALPERTEGIFMDQGAFLSHSPPGIQERYARFFTDLAVVSRDAFRRIGKDVTVGHSAQNFSEVVNSWLPHWMFDAAGIVPFDHYGITHTPEELEADLRRAYRVHARLPLFHQEWGDYWNARMPAGERTRYLRAIFDVLSRLADEGIVVGFNYWGGWTGDGEGILVRTGTDEDPRFELNDRGRVLAEYFAAGR